MIVDGYHYDKSLFIRDREDGKIHKIYYNTLGDKFLTKKHDFDYEDLAYSLGEEDISSCSEFIIRSSGGYTTILRACMNGNLFPGSIRVRMMLEWLNIMAGHYDKHISISGLTEDGEKISIKNGVSILGKIMDLKDVEEKREQGDSIIGFFPIIFDEAIKFEKDMQKMLYEIASTLDFTSRAVAVYQFFKIDVLQKDPLAMEEVDENLANAINSLLSALEAKNAIIKQDNVSEFSSIKILLIMAKMIDAAFDVTKNRKKEL